jgi:hypothetical protein
MTRSAPLVLDPLVQSNQIGDNRVQSDQVAGSQSGRAVSGSQRIRVRVDGDALRIRILAQNVAPFASAASGDALSANVVEGQAGPIAAGLVGGAQASQLGNNDVELGQAARAQSGDAVAGSQEIGVEVHGSVKELAVLAQNTAPGALASSGRALASNDAIGAAGPVAAAGLGSAQAAQTGNNRVVIDQLAQATSGDALAGSQVIGVDVSGHVDGLAVMASNGSAGSLAHSGDAVARNSAAAVAGPSSFVFAGDAMSAQFGSNDVIVDQRAEATSGLALSGAQLVSIRAMGGIGQGAVMPMNDSALTLALSGAAVAGNSLLGTEGPIATGLVGNAMTQQAGLNSLTADQDVQMQTGDALSSAQVVKLLAPSRGAWGGGAPPSRSSLFGPKL